MKLGLMGYGAMGRMVSARARDAGFEVGLVLTSEDSTEDADALADRLSGHHVAIDFSVADAVPSHVAGCMRAGVPIVIGTTGWRDREADVRRSVEVRGGALIYGANFSIGVNLFYRIIAHAAELFRATEDYAPFIEEAHHARKRDAPSGTALRLSEILCAGLKRNIPLASTRAGFIPGTHRVGFDSAADQIMLIHTARSREGFAAGALLAARWIIGRQGVYEFSTVLDQILKQSTQGG